MNYAVDAVFAGSVSKTWTSFRRRVQALDALTLRIPQGAAFGLLGPNGAGKTTFVKVLIGAVTPTSGMATVFGHPAGSVIARSLLGYVPESAAAPLHLTPEQLIGFQCALHGLSPSRRRLRTVELLDQVGMSKWANLPLAKCSRGMRQRASIAAALAPEPKLLILDEPTDGLDPAARREVLDLLRCLNRDEGVTLLISSHVLSEIEDLCSEVAILSHGRLARTGAVADLTAGVGYTVTLVDAPGQLDEILAARGVTAFREGPGTVRLQVPTRDQLDWTLDCARAAAARVELLARSTGGLETAYLAAIRSEEAR